MFNHFKKYFLLFSSLSLLLSTYAMENENISIIFQNAVIEFLKGNSQEENLQTIKQCIDEDGVAPDYKMDIDVNFSNVVKNNMTVLMLAAHFSNKNLFTYLLQKGANVNNRDKKGYTPFYHLLGGLRKNPEKFDAEIFEYLLNHTNRTQIAIGQNAETPLSLMCRINDSNLLKLFIKHGLNVKTLDCLGSSSLSYAIAFNRIAGIKEFCHAGALIYKDLKNNNTFHAIAIKKIPKESLKALITHIRFDSYFDSYNKDQEEKERKVLAVFSVLSTLPRDLRFYILDELTLVDDDYCFNKKLCKKLLDKGHMNHIVNQVNKRVKYIDGLLQVKNDCGKTALNLLHETKDNQYIQELEPLLNRTELKKDLINFENRYFGQPKAEFPENNLVSEMAYNCIRVLKEN